MSYDDSNIELLVGKTLKGIENHEDEMLFICEDEDRFKAYHMQGRCKGVSIYDVKGDIQSILGSKIIEATEMISHEWPSDVPIKEYTDSFTWTTHIIRAANGNSLVVRWLGESNGYYSESVYVQRTHTPYSYNKQPKESD